MALAAARDLPVGKRTAGIDEHVKALECPDFARPASGVQSA
jgi:hypothetical protein